MASGTLEPVCGSLPIYGLSPLYKTDRPLRLLPTAEEGERPRRYRTEGGLWLRRGAMAGASLALLPFLLSFVSHLACRAGASSSTGSAQLLFKILNATQANGDPLDGWDAATLVKSVEPGWKPGTVGSKEADVIASLPGQPQDSASVKQYGGYVDIGDGEKLFYYFVECFRSDVQSLPVVLWISGGRKMAAGSPIVGDLSVNHYAYGLLES